MLISTEMFTGLGSLVPLYEGDIMLATKYCRSKKLITDKKQKSCVEEITVFKSLIP